MLTDDEVRIFVDKLYDAIGRHFRPFVIFMMIFGVIYLFAWFLNVDLVEPESTKQVVEEKQSNIDASVLDLPLRYFDYGLVSSGSAGGEWPDWNSAYMKNGYRSYPTTTISLTDYDTTSADLPPLPTDAEFAEIADEGIFGNRVRLESEKFGDFSKRYAAQYEMLFIEEADVTGDGVPELLLGVSGIGGNHLPHYYQIIQRDKIIFTAGKGTVLLQGLEPDPTGNGFILKWVNDEQIKNTGLCCPLGHMSTRFVFENSQFVPVYEQEEFYYEVKNTDKR